MNGQTIKLKNTGDVKSVIDGAARKGITAGAAPDDPTPDDVGRLKAMAEYISAQAALETARTAAANAKVTAATTNLGPLASTVNTGTVTAAANAGKLEGTILAARATAAAADGLAIRVCHALLAAGGGKRCEPGYKPSGRSLAGPVRFQRASSPPPAAGPETLSGHRHCGSFAAFARPFPDVRTKALVIMANGQKTGFDAYDLLTLRLNSAGRQLCSALASAATANARTKDVKIPKPAPANVKRGLVAGLLPGASAGIDLVAKLFRSEYSVANIDVGTDDQLLEKELIRALYARDVEMPIYAPDLHSVVDVEANPIVEKLKILDELARGADLEAQAQSDQQSRFAAGAKGSKGGDEAVLSSAAQVHDGAAKMLSAAVKRYDDLLAAAGTSDADKPNPLTTAIRQANVAEILRSGGTLLVAKMDAAGATTYTKRNFFTAFGAMPFYASGGVVASYTLVDGATGQILDTSSLPVTGGFKRVTEVR